MFWEYSRDIGQTLRQGKLDYKEKKEKKTSVVVLKGEIIIVSHQSCGFLKRLVLSVSRGVAMDENVCLKASIETCRCLYEQTGWLSSKITCGIATQCVPESASRWKRIAGPDNPWPPRL
jgi:hypothetical protein